MAGGTTPTPPGSGRPSPGKGSSDGGGRKPPPPPRHTAPPADPRKGNGGGDDGKTDRQRRRESYRQESASSNDKQRSARPAEEGKDGDRSPNVDKAADKLDGTANKLDKSSKALDKGSKAMKAAAVASAATGVGAGASQSLHQAGNQMKQASDQVGKAGDAVRDAAGNVRGSNDQPGGKTGPAKPDKDVEKLKKNVEKGKNANREAAKLATKKITKDLRKSQNPLEASKKGKQLATSAKNKLTGAGKQTGKKKDRKWVAVLLVPATILPLLAMVIFGSEFEGGDTHAAVTPAVTLGEEQQRELIKDVPYEWLDQYQYVGESLGGGTVMPWYIIAGIGAAATDHGRNSPYIDSDFDTQPTADATAPTDAPATDVEGIASDILGPTTTVDPLAGVTGATTTTPAQPSEDGTADDSAPDWWQTEDIEEWAEWRTGAPQPEETEVTPSFPVTDPLIQPDWLKSLREADDRPDDNLSRFLEQAPDDSGGIGPFLIPPDWHEQWAVDGMDMTGIDPDTVLLDRTQDGTHLLIRALHNSVMVAAEEQGIRPEDIYSVPFGENWETWVTVVGRLGLGHEQPDCTAPAGKPVADQIQSVFSCMAVGVPIHTLDSYGKPMSTVEARGQMMVDALDYAWMWSKWGNDLRDGCEVDPDTGEYIAAYGGIFPAPRSLGNRCDATTNLKWAAETFLSGESIPFAERPTSPAGAAAAGGWANFPLKPTGPAGSQDFLATGPRTVRRLELVPGECSSAAFVWARSLSAVLSAEAADTGAVSDSQFDSHWSASPLSDPSAQAACSGLPSGVSADDLDMLVWRLVLNQSDIRAGSTTAAGGATSSTTTTVQGTTTTVTSDGEPDPDAPAPGTLEAEAWALIRMELEPIAAGPDGETVTAELYRTPLIQRLSNPGVVIPERPRTPSYTPPNEFAQEAVFQAMEYAGWERPSVGTAGAGSLVGDFHPVVADAYTKALGHIKQENPACDIDVFFIATIGLVESTHGTLQDATIADNGDNYRPDGKPITSHAGAQGPMQFMPGTWPGYARDGDGDGVTNVANFYDASWASAVFVCEMVKRHGASLQTVEGRTIAVIGYNAGPLTIDKYKQGGLGVLPTETQKYLIDAEAYYQKLLAASAAAGGGGLWVGGDCSAVTQPVTIDQTAVFQPGNIRVHLCFVPQAQALLQKAHNEGLPLTGSGWRDPQRQIELRMQNCGTSHYAIYEMRSSNCSPPTARPGSSNHERGLAIDFSNCGTRGTACYQWLAVNAEAFSIFNLPSESWHWSVNGG